MSTEEDLKGSPTTEFIQRGDSIPVDLPPGVINPSAISSLIEQNGGQVGYVLVIKADGIAGWQPVSVLVPPGTVTELNDLTDVILAGLGTGDLLIFNGTTWVNGSLVANQLPNHATRHESGGADPLALGSIAGTLVDAQVIESNVRQWDSAAEKIHSVEAFV